jgi:cation:H+ antiporter
VNRLSALVRKSIHQVSSPVKQAGDGNIKIIGSYWSFFAYCILASVIVRLIAPPLPAIVILSFTGVIFAAILISWGAEAAQFVVSQGLAIAIVALLQVVPEFMVEATIAWHREIDLMMANFTGSNRLLMGVGWALVFFTADVYSRIKTGRGITHIELRRETLVEVLVLMASSGYFFLVLIHGSLSIIDSIVLAAIFVLYMVMLQKLPEEEAEKKQDLIAMPRYLANITRPREQAFKLFGIFLVGGLTMWAMAEPFLLSMKSVAVVTGVTAFVFVQWCAPFLSEFPEKVTAFYWARSVRLAPMALLNLISSKVNQWTLLVAMIPLVYSISLGHWQPIPLDAFHRQEILLSLMMTLYGGVTLLKLRFTRLDALSLFGLWLVQFIFPQQLPLLGDAGWNNTRLLTAGVFGVLMIVELVRHRNDIHLYENLSAVVKSMQSDRALLELTP